MSTRRAAVAAAAFVLAAAWIAWDELWVHGGDRTLAWVDLTARTSAAPRTAGLHVFHSHSELRKELPSATVPPIDFGRRTAVLLASGPRSSTAYVLRVVSVIEERRRVRVAVREEAPSLAAPGTPTLAFPYRLIAIQASRKPVVVERIGRP